MATNACRQLRRTEFVVNSYTETIPAGVLLDDLMGYSYWVNVADLFRINDVINVIAADGSFDASLRIIRMAPGFLEFRVLSEWRPEIRDNDSGRFEIGWGGPKAKWFVREIATGKKLAEGLDKPAAVIELQRLDSLKDAA